MNSTGHSKPCGPVISTGLVLENDSLSQRAQRLKAWIPSLRICWMGSLPLGSSGRFLFAASSLALGTPAPADDHRSLMRPPWSKRGVATTTSGCLQRRDDSWRAYLAAVKAKTDRRSVSRGLHEGCSGPNRPPFLFRGPGGKTTVRPGLPLRRTGWCGKGPAFAGVYSVWGGQYGNPSSPYHAIAYVLRRGSDRVMGR